MDQAGYLAQRIAGLAEKIKRRKEREPLPGAPLPANVTRLPLWPDPVRGVPNGMLRSALFGAIRKGPRRYLEGEKMAAQEGIEIRYTGPRLDQGDLDVWSCVLHIARTQALGDRCHFTAYALLKMLGKTDSGKNRNTLHKRLLRLKANGLELQQGRYTYIGSLIDEVYRDEETHEYVVILNAKLRPLFERDQFTQLEWAVRRELDGQPLAQWLHGYYSSHAKPYPVGVEKLRELCGSEAVRLDHYRQDLKKALAAVTETCVKHGHAFSAEIHGDLVHVERRPSASQRRHMAKK
jgi:hypothetical protein